MHLATRFKILCSTILMLVSISTAAAATPSVSVIFSADNDFYQQVYEAFSETLKTLGCDSSRARIFVQHPNPDYFSWANSARRAVAAGNEVLVTLGAAATRVALRETSSQQVVYAGLVTPLDAHLVGLPEMTSRDFAQASGAVCQLPVATLIKSYVEIMRGRTIGAVFFKGEPEQEHQLHLLEQAASIYGISVKKFIVSPGNVVSTLKRAENAVDALYIPVGVFDSRMLAILFKEASLLHLPVLGASPGYASRGALASLEVDARGQGEWLARHLVAVLDGKKSDFEPFKQSPVDLIINLKTAENLNLRVPFETLTAASKIIR